MATIHERIKLLREQHSLLQKELADKLGVSTATISAWEQGTREPNPSQRDKLCKFFHVTASQLFGDPQIEVKNVDIPIVSSVGATDDTGQAHFLPHEPPYRHISFTGCKAVVVESSSMAPIAYKGQKIIYCETEPVRDGDLVFVKFVDGAQLFKRYYKNHGDMITFHSINPVESPKPIIKKPKEIEFCYKVVGVKF